MSLLSRAMRIVVVLAPIFFDVCLVRAAPEAAPRRKIVLLIAGQSYATERTLPAFAARCLAADFRVVTVTGAMTNPLHRFDHSEEIEDADLLLVSVWRRNPPRAQLELIRRYVAAGKPVVGIATASHAFARRKGAPSVDGQEDWPEWDAAVIGGNYGGHRRIGLITVATSADSNHPILAGVTLPLHSKMELNQVSPLQPGAHVVLTGRVEGFSAEPVAWTFVRSDGGKTFFTPLGHPEDFDNASFQRLLENGIRWALQPASASAESTRPR